MQLFRNAFKRLRPVIGETPVGRAWDRLRQPHREARQISDWIASGRPLPPPSAVKAQTLRDFARRLKTPTLVETGTYMGDMIFAVRGSFQSIYSIELDPVLHRRAQLRFANDERIRLYCGDSAHALDAILDDIQGPCLFWLDAHYSGEGTARATEDSPIVHELGRIFARPSLQPVLLIDDARLFVGRDGYPSLKDLEARIFSQRPGWTIETVDDIIRAYGPLD